LSYGIQSSFVNPIRSDADKDSQEPCY
jgi:hypothetical protein